MENGVKISIRTCEYQEIVFSDGPDLYLRFADPVYYPNWNMIGIEWSIMDGGWVRMCTDEMQLLENKYQRCLNELHALKYPNENA